MSTVLRRTLVCGVAALALAAPATADTIGVTLGLVSGTLTVRAQPTAVDGTAVIAVRVADGRGTGNGWTVRLQTGNGVTVAGITATCAAHSTCTLPTMVGVPSGTTVLRAAQNTGMGVIDLRVTVQTSAQTSVRFAIS
jgi:hypothetical protein